MSRPEVRRSAFHSTASRLAATGLLLGGMLLCTCGASCENSDFRQTAASAIGDGIKTIIDGIIDGAVSAVSNAGDDASS